MPTLLEAIDDMVNVVKMRCGKARGHLSEGTIMRIIELQYGMHVAMRNGEGPPPPPLDEASEEELQAYLDSVGEDTNIIPFPTHEDDADTIDEPPTTEEV